jgi:CubicO group peptidase (beta-lactamase class C family)
VQREEQEYWAVVGDGGQAAASARPVAVLPHTGPVLGIDVGGSATRAVLVDDGAVVRTLTAAPFNYLLQDDPAGWLAGLIRDCGATAVGVGMPGIAREPGAAESLAAEVSTAAGVPVRVVSDAATAWLGAFLGGPGIAVIAGTGSVAVGGGPGSGPGHLLRCGGYGYLLGDEGGGYWIGRQAMRAAVASADGTGPATVLGEVLSQAAGVGLDQLLILVHRDPRDRTILARLAPAVAQCAASGADGHGDDVASAIIAAAAAELAGLAQALARRLAGAGHRGLPVAGLGGVFEIDSLRATFVRRVGAVAPLARPELGAALLAMGPAGNRARVRTPVRVPAPVRPRDAATVLAAAVAVGQLPGAVYAAGTGADIREIAAVGQACDRGGPARPMSRDTLFDLASLTKVVATLPAVLRLADLGEVGLDDPVTRYLPSFTSSGREQVTVRHLLAHCSGLPAELPLWHHYADRDEAAAALLTAPLERRPASAVVYSDPGFMLLGRIVTAVSEAPLAATITDLVTGPLGMNRTSFCPDPALHDQCAATEVQPDGTALSGVVHDENARVLGGVSGHAGLFAPVDDLISYVVRGWLDPASRVLSAAVREQACRLQTAGLGGRRGLGWVLRGDPADPLSSRWPATAVSHTGFTGTSLAFDPVSTAWVILLTNDVHHGRGRNTIRSLRTAVHDAGLAQDAAAGCAG